MLIGVVALLVFAQWAVLRRPPRRPGPHRPGPRRSSASSALAIINAQAYVYNQMELPIAEGGYAGHVLRHHRHVRSCCSSSGSCSPASPPSASSAAATTDREIVAAHALYWYVLACAFSAVWFIVYVTK